MQAFDKDHFMSLNILKKEAYSGSMRGMRYRLEQVGEKSDPKIVTYIWPEPFCFEKTEDDKKTSKEFEFSELGKEQIVIWLNEQFESKKEVWKKVSR
ncbi:MAG: GNAT family acetyltransferase [Velocimicrobium sp.]